MYVVDAYSMYICMYIVCMYIYIYVYVCMICIYIVSMYVYMSDVDSLLRCHDVIVLS